MKKIMFNDRYGLTRAVLDGRKTQTRRIIPEDFFSLTWDEKNGTLWYENSMGDFIDVRNSKYALYKVGEVVAVAKSYCSIADELENDNNATCAAHYEKNLEKAAEYLSWMENPGFSNKMFVRADLMPHHIRITDVRVEHLQDISDEDCIKEGIIKKWHAPACKNYYYVPGIEVKSVKDVHDTPQEAFAHLINKVSRKDVWSKNPYVFVYDFEFVKNGIK